jgi:hypothetical protein
VDGSDLEDVATTLEFRLEAFIVSRQWLEGDAWVVNRRHGPQTCTRPGDLELWDLGLNIRLPDAGAERDGWLADLETTVQFLSELRSEFAKDFVLGVADSETVIAEDLFWASTSPLDLDRLRRIIGVGDTC